MESYEEKFARLFRCSQTAGYYMVTHYVHQFVRVGRADTKYVLENIAYYMDKATGYCCLFTEEHWDQITEICEMDIATFKRHVSLLQDKSIVKITQFSEGFALSIPEFEETRWYQDFLEKQEQDRLDAIARRGEASGCPPALRKRVYSAFCVCEYCGSVTDDPSVDRIIPRKRGGKYTAENVTFSCRPCNVRKGAREFIGPIRSLAMMEACK